MLAIVKESDLHQSITWAEPLTAEEYWVPLIRKGSLKVHQAIFLSQLSKLTSLTIGYNDDLGFAFLGAMFRRSLCSDAPPAGLSNFNQLRKIDLCIDIRPRDITIYMGFSHELVHYCHSSTCLLSKDSE